MENKNNNTNDMITDDNIEIENIDKNDDNIELSSIKDDDNDDERILKLIQSQQNNEIKLFKINIQISSTKNIILQTECNKNTTILELKKIIMKELNKDNIDNIELQYNGNNMDNNSILSDYNIIDSKHLIKLLYTVQKSDASTWNVKRFESNNIETNGQTKTVNINPLTNYQRHIINDGIEERNPLDNCDCDCECNCDCNFDWNNCDNRMIGCTLIVIIVIIVFVVLVTI